MPITAHICICSTVDAALPAATTSTLPSYILPCAMGHILPSYLWVGFKFSGIPAYVYYAYCLNGLLPGILEAP